MSELPPGFVLDQPAPQQQPGQLPPGFVVDQPERGAWDMLTGATGPRYKLWPERMVRDVVGAIQSGVTLPGDVVSGKQQMYLPSVSDDPRRPDFVGNAGPGGQVINPEFTKRSLDFATIASPINPAVRSGDRAIPGVAKNMVPVKVKTPTTEELARVGGEQIQAARQSGLDVTADSVSRYAANIKRDLFEQGIHPVDAPATYAKIAELENAPPGAFFTASNLQSIRSSLGATAQNFNPAASRDQLAAAKAIKSLDEFIPSLSEKDVLAGAPAATQKLFEAGRGNYAAAMRSNSLTGNLDRANTGLIERAENRAQASYSGRNIDNTLRQKLASALEKPKEVSGFSDAEIAALNQSIQGSTTRNVARAIGNKFGGGGGAGQTGLTVMGAGLGAGAGSLAGQPVAGAAMGAAVPEVLGASARALANALAKKSVRGVDDLVRQRSPLYLDAVRQAGVVGAPTAKEEALIKALLGMSLTQQQ